MKRVAIFLVLLLVAAVAFVASRPSEFLITRTRTLAAPPEVVHAHVADFHEWAEWSPWEEIDPGMRREYSGAPAGPGASYHWSGNDEAGEGRMTITGSQAPGRVTIRLEFLRPFPATNTVDFYIDKTGLGTDVTWVMSGQRDFMAKAVALFVDVDAMVGERFEAGLAQLDAVTAAAASLTHPAPAPEPAPVPAPEAPPAAE